MQFRVRNKEPEFQYELGSLLDDQGCYSLSTFGKIFHKDFKGAMEGMFVEKQATRCDYVNLTTIYNGDIITYVHSDEEDTVYTQMIRDDMLDDSGAFNEYTFLEHALDDITILDINTNKNGMYGPDSLDYDWRVFLKYQHDVPESPNEELKELLIHGFINGHTSVMSPFELLSDLMDNDCYIVVGLRTEHNIRYIEVTKDKLVYEFENGCPTVIRGRPVWNF